jgi:hypothetical protein
MCASLRSCSSWIGCACCARAHLRLVARASVRAHSHDEVRQVCLRDVLQAKFGDVPLVYKRVEVVILAMHAVAAHVLGLDNVVRVDVDDRLHHPGHALDAPLRAGLQEAPEATDVCDYRLAPLALHMCMLCQTVLCQRSLRCSQHTRCRGRQHAARCI